MYKHQYHYPDGNFELLYVTDYYPCRDPKTGEVNNDFYDNNCGILLDFKQNKGDSLDYVRGYLYNDPDTSFEELPAEWVCPICGMPKSAFVRK